ncbi:MAG: leucyl/phenylalanyl-tRNA--protein transferase [Deltaproteobacteria bacterium SG8_13]|nr:MAG: leucyl/phenylalanyl-tRNA--protein transferase [Deltaproteobacteria bacterium SG8_13]
MPVFFLSEKIAFPPPHFATREGLLAVGGDLTRERLLAAYRQGIFPWYAEGDPILWWSPDPRLVLYPDHIHVSRTLQRVLNKQLFSVTMDSAFQAVITGCAETRLKQDFGTWIVEEIRSAYIDLHRAGYAHSVEVWAEGELAGGLYGVSLGRCFYGESMFTLVDNASNVALVHLARALAAQSFELIDCQVSTDHLIRMGAREIPRSRFLRQLRRSLTAPTLKGRWEYAQPAGMVVSRP